LVTAWRLAICPTRISPLSSQATTDGVMREPSSLTMTLGSLPSMMATHAVGRAEVDTDDLAHESLPCSMKRTSVVKVTGSTSSLNGT
jgi:hypothetical protein